MTNGIVTNWSKNPPHPPFFTVSISLLCIFALLVYTGLSPVMQQAMIEVGGMQPSLISSLLEEGPGSWWNISSISIVSALIIHASRCNQLA